MGKGIRAADEKVAVLTKKNHAFMNKTGAPTVIYKDKGKQHGLLPLAKVFSFHGEQNAHLVCL